MILEIEFNGENRRPSDWIETDKLISEAIRFISPDKVTGGVYIGGSTAWFSTRNPQAKNPSAYLRVSANDMSGYGALIWITDGQPPRKGGIYDHIWISDNPAPSNIDSWLMSDPYLPTYHDPASAVPLPQIRAAIEEFCRSEGERPECISWVTGQYNGHRDDKPEPEPISFPDQSGEKYYDGSPWAE
ncbi:Imm1 family immunity protein [Kitasatospora griseola]|uniref:Imm1 family immunity protein n=1 Tax=Kitasatospora griseola TaxID=2064 RepID=UPI0038054B86